MAYVIRSNITTKTGDEFAPISQRVQADLGLTQRQVLNLRVEAAKRREAQRIIDAADRHSELAMLTGMRQIEVKRPPWWLMLVPLAALAGLVALIALLLTAGWWL
jgi:hypothetical protein